MDINDQLLRFANLVVLSINTEGLLQSIQPEGESFCGWDEQNRAKFNLDDHLLAPNRLTRSDLLQLLDADQPQPTQLAWDSPDMAMIPETYSTLLEKSTTEAGEAIIQATIRIAPDALPEGNIDHKKYYFQARNLPGLIHNINGPLGTIFGRTELLKYKYPDIADIEEILKVGYRLQNILSNFSFKINNETYNDAVAVNLNRFLCEEISFLDSDLFFKHNVHKQEDYCDQIPEFRTNYFALSGIFSESYHFFRQFFLPKENYNLLTRSFSNQYRVGFEICFTGRFNPNGVRGAQLPMSVQGDHNTLINSVVKGLDTALLAECMIRQDGHIKLSCGEDQLCLNYQLPVSEAEDRLEPLLA